MLEGPEAIDDLLYWLQECRRIYGYAWRVLVDPRCIAPIREHPRYKAFVAEEDAIVESVEAAITAGVYPL
jgi:hypothetical protein